MSCEVCKKSPAEDHSIVLRRINQFGVPAIWRCQDHMDGFKQLVHESQVELWEDKPHFIHSPECPNYCDYACNGKGFEQAEKYFAPGNRPVTFETRKGRLAV